MAQYGNYNITVKAKIRGKIVIIELASNDRWAYRDIKDKITYLGCGLYYSYNDVKATDKQKTHFWKFK